MPRRDRPTSTSRSEHWLRIAVNERTDWFDERVRETLRLDRSEHIEWRSPVASDEFAEYFDAAFLDRLGVRCEKVSLRDFWPAGGPRWDGLARTGSGKLILVEAKAYVEEAVDFKSGARGTSLDRIRTALQQAKSAFRARNEANWEQPFYQYANRLAHLYFLNTLNELDARLLFVCFAEAPDVPEPATHDEWLGAIRVIEAGLGIRAHPYRSQVGHLIVSVPEMNSDSPSPGVPPSARP